MERLKIKLMELHSGNTFDINELVKWVTIVSGAVIAIWKWIDGKFKEKKLEAEQARIDREAFITRVAEAAVKSAMNGILGDVKDDIQTLFKYREEDRKHIDRKFETIMVEMKK